MSGYKGTEFYRRIADLCLSGAMTQPEIAEAYGVNQSSVARWVRVCRDLDLLPPTYKGKPAWAKSCPMCGATTSGQNPYNVQPPYAPTA